jgi:hypothetical protein
MRRLALLVVLLAPAARAEIQTAGPQVWPGKHELGAALGYQAGIGSYQSKGIPAGAAPSGFKLLADYAYRFHELAWLHAGVNFVFGGGCDTVTIAGGCSSFANGWIVEPMVGVKLKWKTSLPLVPYAKFDAGFVGIYNRYCGDNGFAIVGRIGGGAKWWLLKNIGVGAELHLAVGPGVYGGTDKSSPCSAIYYYDAHVEAYAAFDFALGAEFIF